MTNELVIRGGTVVDGTGAPPKRADVGVTLGKVSEVGDRLEGDQEMDASGLVVAPGFIDIHTHYDAQVLWDPALTPSCWQGVTTVIAGNCGFSVAPCRSTHRGLIARTLQHVEAMTLEPLEAGIDWDFETFPDYLEAVRRRGPLLNYGQFLGHSALRLFVMGDEGYERSATDVEIAAMREVLAEGLLSGAIGFSTSLSSAHQGDAGRPVPSRMASAHEVAALVGVLGEAGRGVLQILPGDEVSLDDVFGMASTSGRPVVFSEVLTRPDGEHWKRLEALTRARASGSRNLWGLMAVHPIVFQYQLIDPFPFNSLPDVARLHAAPPDERLRCYGDAEWRSRIQTQLDSRGQAQWGQTFFAETSRSELIDRSVADVAAGWAMSPLDAMMRTALEEGLSTRFRVVLVNDDQDSIDRLLQADGLLVGLSDAGAHATQLCDAGFAARVLGTFVRERQAVALEHGVRKLTGEPAAALGLSDRGVLKPGMAADITVFDAGTIAPGPVRRVWDFPAGTDRLVADRPEGIIEVLVNGIAIRRDGRRVDGALDRHPGELVTDSPPRGAGRS